MGTTTNSDIPTEVERDPAIDGNETRQEGNGQIDYDNPTKETHTVRTAAYLTDCSVTVTITWTKSATMWRWRPILCPRPLKR